MNALLPMPISGPITPAQKTTLRNLVRRAARAEILPRFRNLSAAEIDTKSGPEDLVTEADRAAEKMIARGLIAMFPNALIVGEEDVAGNPKILDKISDAETAFTIDPVDGTANFAQGLATFGVIISMLRFGTPVFGLHYDPIMDDVVMADRDSPTVFQAAGKAARKVQVSKGGALADIKGFVPFNIMPKAHQPAIAQLFIEFRRLANLRCSCHEYRQLAQGHVDFVITANDPAPWDHAAGTLLVQQAGGYVAFLDGSEYSANRLEGYVLSASNKEVWTAVREAFAFLIDTPEAPAAPS